MSQSHCCNVELEIAELKNFLTHSFDIVSRRFDEQDGKLSILVEAINEANFGHNLPTDVCIKNEIYESNNLVTTDGPNCNLKSTLTVSCPQSESLDNKASNILLIHNKSFVENVFNDQIEDNTCSGLKSVDPPLGQSSVQLLESGQSAITVCDFAIKEENIDSDFVCASTSYDHLGADRPRETDSTGHHDSSLVLHTDDDDDDESYLSDLQSGTSFDDASILHNKPPTPLSHCGLVYDSKPKKSARCEELNEILHANSVKRQAATELRRVYLSRLNKFRNQMQLSTTQNSDHQIATATAITTNAAAITNEIDTLQQEKTELELNLKLRKTCPICSKEFSSTKRMMMHKKGKHPTTLCPICSKKFGSTKAMLCHKVKCKLCS